MNAPQAAKKDFPWGWKQSLGLGAIIIFILVLGLVPSPAYRLRAWLAIMILLFLFVLIVGHGITGLCRGVLVDERNKISLSRLQMILWSILVLSGFITIALGNIQCKDGNPLNIAIPTELWILMGISTASLVGSPLILSNKKTKTPDDKEMTKTFNLMGVEYHKITNKILEDIKAAPPQQAPAALANTVTNVGQVVFNLNPKDISWADLFRGEETGNAAQVDLAKVQMFFFTVLVVLGYGVAMGAKMFTGSPLGIHEFPPLHQSLVTLLGISHAGYLANKAVPHSETQTK